MVMVVTVERAFTDKQASSLQDCGILQRLDRRSGRVAEYRKVTEIQSMTALGNGHIYNSKDISGKGP